MRNSSRQIMLARRIACGLCLVLMHIALPNRALAQSTLPAHDPDSFINQQRSIDEKIRSDFESELGDLQRVSFDWGGFYSTHLFIFDDSVESSRTLRRYDLRLWGRVSLDQGAHEFYARGRWSLLDFNAGESYDGDDDDVEGPNLERGIYKFDLNKSLRANSQPINDYNIILRLGRDLVQFGQGLSLATPLDHIAVQYECQNYELTGLFGRTVGSTQDFDLSRTASRQRRDFLGVQLKYKGLERHRPFVYALWQHDRNRENLFSPLQRFDYDSFYFGLGASGEWIKGLYYVTEAVYQTGRSFGHQQFLYDNDIEAWALRAQLEYLYPGQHKAKTSVEYLFGSGDSDRRVSPTNTVNGNRGDRTDNSFIGFGYRNTGLSFAPRYSNLHMGRVGASYHPLPDHSTYRNLEVGADAFVYYKNHRDGAVSDPTARRRSGYLGSEIDFFMNWRMSADFAWTTRVGSFFPGKSFDDRTTRNFFLVGMTWSF